MSAAAAPASSGWAAAALVPAPAAAARARTATSAARAERASMPVPTPGPAQTCGKGTPTRVSACGAEQLDLGQLDAAVLAEIGDPHEVVAVGLAGGVEVDRG